MTWKEELEGKSLTNKQKSLLLNDLPLTFSQVASETAGSKMSLKDAPAPFPDVSSSDEHRMLRGFHIKIWNPAEIYLNIVDQAREGGFEDWAQ